MSTGPFMVSSKTRWLVGEHIGYIQQVRSVLELAVSVWHLGLTISNKIYIEIVQKSACNKILGNIYILHDQALFSLGLEELHITREKLCRVFAIKSLHSEK